MIEVEPVEEEDVDIRTLFLEFLRRRTRQEVLLCIIWLGLIFAARYYGVVDLFIIVTTFIGIFRYGLSNRSDQEGDASSSRYSAYSIFNPGFREIQGTFNTGHIEQDLLGVRRDGGGGETQDRNVNQEDLIIADDEEDEELQEAIRRSLADTTSRTGGAPSITKKKAKEVRKNEKKARASEFLRAGLAAAGQGKKEG